MANFSGRSGVWKELTSLVRVLLYALFYFGIGSFGLKFGAVGGVASPIWPPSGISVAVLSLWGWRYALGVLLGAFWVNLPATENTWAALVIAAGNTLESMVAVWFLNRFKIRRALESARDILLFIAFCACVAPLVSALIGTLASWLAGRLSNSVVALGFWSWWVGDAMSILVITPFLLLEEKPRGKNVHPRRVETLIFMVALILASFEIFRSGNIAVEGEEFLRPYLIFPFLIWVSMRLTRRAAFGSILIITTVATFLTVQAGENVFGAHLTEKYIHFQLFVAVLGFTNLFFSAVVTELKQAERKESFLSEASLILGSSLDLSVILEKVADVAMVYFDSWCSVFVEKEGRLVPMATRYTDPRYAGVSEVLQKNSSNFLCPSKGPVAVMRTGVTEYLPRLAPQDIQTRVLESRNQAVMIGLGMKSYICVPLKVRDRAFGCFALSTLTHFYQPQDFEVAEELARRAAFAIENAQLYRQAQESIRIREEIVSFVSHDLKTPLSAILLGLQLIERKLATKDGASKIGDSVVRVKRSALHMSELIRNILDIRQIEGGRLRIHLEKELVQGILEELSENFHMLAEAGRVHLVISHVSEALSVQCDRSKVLQVLSNLVSNALRVTQPGGEVKLEAKEVDEGVEFGVKDTGPGIPAENIPFFFDRGWQAKRRELHGTGLGLAIAKGIVEAHHGRIWIESEIGKGTVFYFRIPRSQVEKQD